MFKAEADQVKKKKKKIQEWNRGGRLLMCVQLVMPHVIIFLMLSFLIETKMKVSVNRHGEIQRSDLNLQYSISLV